jgi:UDP-glucose 4-epimerase
MQRVLITGGTGYIGSHLSAYLAQKAYRVTVLGRFNPCEKYPAWCDQMEAILLGDIRDEQTLSALFERQFDVIIHLIALDYTQAETNLDVLSVNTLPTWRLLKYADQHGVKRFFYFSTERVFGHIPLTNIDESFPPQPLNQHGLSHLLSEQIVNYYHASTDITGVNLRFSNVYGRPLFTENRCWQYVMNHLCEMAFTRHEIRLLSDGSPLRDFIHIADICKAVDVLLGAETVESLYCITSGYTLTILEVAHEVQQVYQKRYGKQIPVYFADGSLSSDPDKYKAMPRYTIATQRMEKIGIQASMNRRDGIRDIFAYLDSHSK